MYLFMRWSLHQGFSDFIETRQKEGVYHLVEGLSDYYASQQNWSKLSGDKQKWIDLLLQSNPRLRSPAWIKQALEEPKSDWPPAIVQESEKRLFPPLELRVMLLDGEKKIIFGREESLPQLTLLPILYQEQIVGYLGLLPGKAVSHVSETQFLERQSESFIWIALLMIGLSAGLALLLAYILGRPIKLITSAAKALAVGRYDMRLPLDSGDELGQLARDFNDMAAALQHSEQARRRWVADISHEFRTPLAVLRGELEALQDGIRPLNAAAIDSLFADVMRLNRLTEDLYLLSLSDEGALSYRKTHVDPIELLKDDLDAIQPDFQNKNIQVLWKENLAHPVSIYADPDRLSQLYRNLLKNSANYTDRNGQLAITISLEKDNLQLNFSDSAPGVPESEIPKLFDRFYRQDSSFNHHPGGAGLGLAICSNIVKAHNGSIQALPSALKGLTIHLEFPLSV
ncbi:ATP-binding protein [Methylomonas sp. AM2-LC]|uniref:ATP-binding protein n=1 Tax=Methylomonas sp. AM2-LC TaxID=3153301 RepID=UPI0032637B67